MCHQMGAGQQYLNSILTECGHFEPVVFLPVILVLYSAVKNNTSKLFLVILEVNSPFILS